MNPLTCCQIAANAAQKDAKAAGGQAHLSSAKKRGFALAKLSVPAMLLALLPKCPACFAAYIALGTGISLSVQAASLLRSTLIAICVAALVWIIASGFRSAPMSRQRL